MSNPNHPVGTQVDPSEGAINEDSEQQSFQRADADEGEESAMLEVDPSEGPME
ncbi:MAG: hypothetical protein QOH49_1112 [Acidobacteriota bacterium]|jgi:hypothetical protein|nr:hypothetical protein [Acidobacteriota bacterium]